MTHVIKCNNVDEALINGMWWLHGAGIESNSRNGRVLVSPEPVITEYLQPRNRVLFNPLRDANPFFHLFESLWMLAGRNDVAFPAHYAKQIAAFSDDGTTIAGAYGERWRSRFGYDQLKVIIDDLKANPDSRRCVLTMWDAFGNPFDNSSDDLHLAMNGGKDVPCNTQAYFDTIGGKLNMTVTCRSNDIIWGCYGANAVHFSILHEYVALSSGIELGVYRQFSNNYHMYIDRPDVQRLLCPDGAPQPMFVPGYNEPGVQYEPLFSILDQESFDHDLATFFKVWTPTYEFMEGESMFETIFFDQTIAPMINAHVAYKAGKRPESFNCAADIQASDWRKACTEWLQRRTK